MNRREYRPPYSLWTLSGIVSQLELKVRSKTPLRDDLEAIAAANAGSKLDEGDENQVLNFLHKLTFAVWCHSSRSRALILSAEPRPTALESGDLLKNEPITMMFVVFHTGNATPNTRITHS